MPHPLCGQTLSSPTTFTRPWIIHPNSGTWIITMRLTPVQKQSLYLPLNLGSSTCLRWQQGQQQQQQQQQQEQGHCRRDPEQWKKKFFFLNFVLIGADSQGIPSLSAYDWLPPSGVRGISRLPGLGMAAFWWCKEPIQGWGKFSTASNCLISSDWSIFPAQELASF